MDLRKFPLDSQACPLEIGSFGFNSKEMIYRQVNLYKALASTPRKWFTGRSTYTLDSFGFNSKEMIYRQMNLYSR
jgi:hypothetical protein